MTIASTFGSEGLFHLPTTFWKQYSNELAQRRLSGVFDNAADLSLAPDSRLFFFSDCHRGNNGRADAFAPNKQLFLDALKHYYERGFTYFEVGDGDELWKNKGLQVIKEGHHAVFEWLHRFHAEKRLHLILGNHELRTPEKNRIKDGIPVHEGIILRFGDALRPIFIAHGHQVDFKSDHLASISRFLVRRVWGNLQRLGIGTTTPAEELFAEQKRIIKGAMRWIKANQNMLETKLLRWVNDTGNTLICGHTHRAVLDPNRMPHYFNPGSCIVPGQITGLEIEHGAISLVRWTNASYGELGRQRLRGPIALPQMT